MVVWSILVAACVGGSAMVLPNIIHRVVSPIMPVSAVGVRIDQGAVWLTVGPVTSTAARAGVHRGDRLLLIDGRPVANTFEGLNRQLAGREGTQVALVTAPPHGRPARHLLVRNEEQFRHELAEVRLAPMATNLLALGLYYLFSDLLILVCAIVLMVRRSHDPLAPWASLMMLCLVLGDSQAGFWISRFFPNPALASAVADTVGYSLLIVVLSVFPTGRFEPRWSLAVAVVGTVVTIANQSPNSAAGNLVLFALQSASVATIAARYRRMSPGTGRQQIRWALLGFAASLVTVLLGSLCQFAGQQTDRIGPFAWSELGSFFFFSVTDALLVIGITVSLLRYRLYDADVTISRSIIYGGLTLGLLAIFAGSEKVIEIMGEQYFGERLGALAGGLGAAVAAVCIGPLHHRVSHWTEKRFRGGLVRLRNGLPLLVTDLRETATPAMLADAVLERVERGVRARHGAVIVDGRVLDARDIDADSVTAWLVARSLSVLPDAGLRCDRADPLFSVRVPLRSDGWGLVGWLLLGPRPDGSFYGRDERDTLQEIAGPISRAIAIAIRREQHVAEQRERENGLRRELAILQRHMETLQSFMADGLAPSAVQARLTS